MRGFAFVSLLVGWFCHLRELCERGEMQAGMGMHCSAWSG